jgi:hypothetical protein
MRSKAEVTEAVATVVRDAEVLAPKLMLPYLKTRAQCSDATNR